VAIASSFEDDPALTGQQEPTPTVVVDVIDNGPGVPSDATDRIFDPFFTTKTEGSGLGLAIVRKIVDAHDGRIVVSRLGAGGTRFRVTLPLAGLPDRPPRLSVLQDAGAPGGPRQR
jgi:signal transduction histidine kinase